MVILLQVKKLWKLRKDEVTTMIPLTTEIQILGYIDTETLLWLHDEHTEKINVYVMGGFVKILMWYAILVQLNNRLREGSHIVEWVKKKMGSFEPAVTILNTKLQGLPDQMVQEMLQTLSIAMFCVNSSPAERPTMKEVVALLMEVKCSPEEWGKTSQPLMKQSSTHS
ncbi:probable LRR receptor-like serine/threonine-protein kinase [Tanacetum coccineum]